MCRHLAYVGEPVRLADLLLTPPHSLLRQSWAPFHGLLHHPLLALAGFDIRVVIVCAAVSNCWQVLEHTSLPVRFPRWFEAVVMTPAAHRHHHARGGGLANVGPFLTCWDRLAGTWVPPDAPAPTAYGPSRPAPANPLAIEVAGWRALRPHRLVAGVDERGAAEVAGDRLGHLVHHVAEREIGVGVGPAE